MLAGVRHAPSRERCAKRTRRYDLNGRLLAALLRGEDTGGHPAAVEVTETRGHRPPRHVHHRLDGLL
jgi:hypothetical protein